MASDGLGTHLYLLPVHIAVCPQELSHISKAQLAEMVIVCHALQEEQKPAATGSVALVRIVQLALVVVAVLAAWQPAAVQAGWARLRATLL